MNTNLKYVVMYTLLLIHYPLFYFNHNEIVDSEWFVYGFGLILAVGFAIVGISLGISKVINKQIKPLIPLVGIFILFSYDYLIDPLMNIGIEIRFLHIALVFIICFILALKYLPNSIKLTKIIFIIISVILVIDIMTLYENSTKPDYVWHSSDDFNNINLDNFPSIIWILPDGYPSSSTLKLLDYDNTNFERTLQHLGFEIIDMKSNSNYTKVSVPTIFNMNYTPNNITFPDLEYMDNSNLMRVLKSNNFETVSIHTIDAYKLNFDVNLCPGNSHEYYMFAGTTLTSFVKYSLLYVSDINAHDYECYFDELSNIQNLDSVQRFTFAHILLPHPPLILKTEIGNLEYIQNQFVVRGGNIFGDKNIIHYLINNVEIFNEELISVLPSVIENNPDTIIIIMSDHGTFVPNIPGSEFDNFLAVHLPENIMLDDIESSVNLFRSLLRNVDPSIPLLEDKILPALGVDPVNWNGSLAWRTLQNQN